MKKFILLLIIPFLSLGQVLTEKEAKSYFTEVANETASMCPMKLDKYTTVTSCLYLHKSRTIMYYGIMDVELYLNEDSGLSRKEIEEFSIKEWQEMWLIEQEKIQTNMFCSSPDLKIFRDNNIIVNYSYVNPSGLHIGNIQLQNSKNCK